MYELAMYMPSPMEHTYHGINPKTKSMHIRHADMSESFTAQVFKTIADPFVGKLSLIKVISGVLTPATPLFNANADAAGKSGGHLHGARQEADSGRHALRGRHRRAQQAAIHLHGRQPL